MRPAVKNCYNKKHARKNSGSDSKRKNFTKNRNVIAAKAITFVLNHKLTISPGLIKKLVKLNHCHQKKTKRSKILYY